VRQQPCAPRRNHKPPQCRPRRRGSSLPRTGLRLLVHADG
jgi:hypothetical protein